MSPLGNEIGRLGKAQRRGADDRGLRIMLYFTLAKPTSKRVIKAWQFKVARLDFFRGIPPKFEP